MMIKIYKEPEVYGPTGNHTLFPIYSLQDESELSKIHRMNELLLEAGLKPLGTLRADKREREEKEDANVD